MYNGIIDTQRTISMKETEHKNLVNEVYNKMTVCQVKSNSQYEKLSDKINNIDVRVQRLEEA